MLLTLLGTRIVALVRLQPIPCRSSVDSPLTRQVDVRSGQRKRRRRRRCSASRSSPRRRPASRRRGSRPTSRRRRRTTIAIRRAPTPRSGSDAGSRISDASATRSTSTHAASRGTRTRRGSTATAATATSRSRKFDRGDRRSAAGVAADRPASRTRSSRTARRTRPASRAARCSRTSGITSASRSTCAATFRRALASYREGMKVSRVNDDMLVATSDWLYMTLRRLKRDAEARQVLEPITRADGHPRERRLSRAAADVQRPAHAGIGAQSQHRRRHADRDAGLRRRQLVSRERRQARRRRRSSTASSPGRRGRRSVTSRPKRI